MILAVDPGRVGGWALLASSPPALLLRCGIFREIEQFPTYLVNVPVLVIEQPHGGKGAASRTDIAKLARRMQQVIDRVQAQRVVERFPNQWKGGSVDGDIMVRRILERWMRPEELAILESQRIGASVVHNCVDAIGIGIHYCATQGWRNTLWR